MDYAGRFGPGLPRISDGSMLFLLNLVSKMETPENGGGRIGIVLSGSPLFTGDAGSGESEILRWLMEQDLVEAILSLPTDIFFNTGIGTYIWILSNKKAVHRKNKVQLINLGDCWTSMRKSEGTKRRHLSSEQINDALREYEDFKETKRSKLFNTTDFAFRKVAIKRPLKAKLLIDEQRIQSLTEAAAFQKLDITQQHAWLAFFKTQLGEHPHGWADQQMKAHHKAEGFGKTSSTLGKAFVNAFIERDPTAEPVRDNKGNIIADTSLNDTESVPWNTPAQDYFEAEVLPHVPDAFIDNSVRDQKDGEIGLVGYEINFNRYFYQLRTTTLAGRD